MYTYLAILPAMLFCLALHSANNEQAINPKLKELFCLVADYGKPLSYIGSGYADVINGQDAKGKTALMKTVCAGIPENVMPLIEAGANPLIKDHKGRDVLTHALKNAYTFSLTIIGGRRCMQAFEKLKQVFEMQDDQEIFKRGIEQGMTFSEYDQKKLFLNVRISKHLPTAVKHDYWAIYCLMLQHFPNDKLPRNYDEIEPHNCSRPTLKMQEKQPA